MQNVFKMGGLVVGVLLFIFLIPWFPTTVTSYENGVKLNLGKVQDDVLREGLHFYNPIISSVSKIDMRERTIDIKTNTVSKEGLQFGIDINVRYRVKDGQAVYMYKNLKTELSDLITSYANATIDDVATGKDKNELYSETGRVEVVNAVKDKLNNELGEYTFITQVIFENINLPSSITEAIQKQQAALETIKEKENMKQVAEKEKEIRIIEAEGIAEANRIIQRTLTREYLQYEAIQKLNPDAEKIYLPYSGLVPTINP